MNFTQFVSAMFGPLKQLTDLSGRSTRAEFWPFMFLLYAGQQVATFIAMNPFMQQIQKLSDPMNPRPPEEVGPALLAMVTDGLRPFFILIAGLGVSHLLLAFAVTVRRLHDSNRSGFHALPIPFFQASGLVLMWMVVDEFLGSGELHMPSLLVPLVLNNLVALAVMVYVIILCALDGTIGPNRYGEDPKGRTEEGEAALRAAREAWRSAPPAPATFDRQGRSAPTPARIVNQEESEG